MSLGPMQAMFATADLLRKHRNAGFEDDQTRKKARWEDEDRALKTDEVKRQRELREGLANDAAPIEVEALEQHGPVRDGEVLPPTMTRFNGQNFATEAQTKAAADGYNAPGAVMRRQADRVLRSGNADGASRLYETGMKLDSSMKADIDRRFNDDVEQRVQDWDTASKFATQSAFDGGAGSIQYRFVPSDEGLMQAQVSVDGKNWQAKPGGRTYKDDPTGFLEAKQDLMRMPTDKKLAHLYGRARAKADDEAAQAKAALEERKVAAYEKQTDAQADLRAAQADAAEARARGASYGPRGGADDQPAAGQVDMGIIDKTIDSYLAPKDEEGKPRPTDPKLKMFVRALAAKSPEAYAGDYEGAALAAVDVYQKALSLAGGDLNKAYVLVTAQMDAAKSGLPGYTVQSATDGRTMVNGKPDGTKPAGRGDERLPPPIGAEAELLAREAAKLKAAGDKARAAKEQANTEVQKARELSLQQIDAMTPEQAYVLLNSAAGRKLSRSVRAELEAKAAASRGVQLANRRGAY